MWSLFRRNARQAKSAFRTPPSYRPRLEALEDRLCPSGGMLDPTFGSGGTQNVTLPSTLYNGQVATVVQPDGKIVSAGMLIAGNKGHEMSVVRMNPNGSLDTSFNGSGYVALKAASSDLAVANTVALQSDGKILVGGWATTSSVTFDYNHEEFVVARLNANGSLDKTFAKQGMFVWYPTSGNNNVNSLAVLSDGSIVAGGISPASYGQDAAVFKLSASGALVSSFGKGGLAVFQPVTGTAIQSMAVGPNGDLILGGNDYINGGGLLIAVNQSTGRLDTNFNNGLGYIADFNPAGHASTVFNAVAIQGNSILAAGNVNGSSYGQLTRFTLTGVLDTTFANGGSFVMTTLTRFDNVAVELDGSLVVSGSNNQGSGWQQMAVGHFTANGQLDPTFGGAGTGFATFPGGDGYGLALAADGSILVCGGGPVSGETLYARLTPPEAMIGSFTASPNPVASGSNVTLTASNIANSNTITQVAFYLDSNNDSTLEPGTDTLLGYATQTSPGVWTLANSSAFGLTKGTYTLFAQAEDSDGVFGDPIALTLIVQ